MVQFVKVNIDDIVYDREQKVEGKVKFINNSTNTAKIEVIVSTDREKNQRTTELIESRLFNLTVIEKSKKQKPDLNLWWSWVRAFHKAFNHPISEKPKQLEADRATNRAIWTGEEALVEFIHASSKDEAQFLELYDRMIKGLEKAKLKSLGMDYYEDGIERVVAQSDALADALYFILGSYVEMGVKPHYLFKAVQDSNMSKLFPDGKPRYREGDGKILKSDQFFPPEPALKAEIERQSK